MDERNLEAEHPAAGFGVDQLGGRKPQADVDLVSGIAELLETGIGNLF